jgi:molybdopterin-guanine dinucleotide biosynthesis protein A
MFAEIPVMKPKEKAEELVDKMKYPMDGVYIINHIANELALILVDEIINSNPHSNTLNTHRFSTMAYWEEVKQEIEKL